MTRDAIAILFLLAACQSQSLTTAENMRLLASDANSVAMLFLDPEEDADTLRDIEEITSVVVEAAAMLEGGAAFSDGQGLLREIDRVLAIPDLDHRVRGALQLLRNRLALLLPS